MNDGKHILVVDDNSTNVELILAALTRHKFSFEVVVANDGDEALDYLYRRGKFLGRNGGAPAVVLLDLKMPRVDGFEVLRQVKGSAELKMIPMVVFSSSGGDQDRLKSYQLGANAYVVKPVGFEEFLEAVRAIGVFWADINQPPPIHSSGARNPARLDVAA